MNNFFFKVKLFLQGAFYLNDIFNVHSLTTKKKGSVSLVGAVIDPVIDNPNHSHVFGITAGGSRGKLMQLSAVTAREKVCT